ncbi:hypothetical protein LTS18_014296, partial [Coniosporium uncinatum]
MHWKKKGHCNQPNGSCFFAHHDTAFVQTASIPSKVLTCFHWKYSSLGCKFGNSCPYAHFDTGIIQDPPVTWTGDLPFDDDVNEFSCPARLPPQVKWVGRARKPQAGEVEHKAFEVKPMLDGHQNLPPLEEQFHRRHGEGHADDRDMCQGRDNHGETVPGVIKGG